MTSIHVEWETDKAVVMLKQISFRTTTFEMPFMKARQDLSAAWTANALSGGSLSGGWPPEKPGTWSADSALPRLRHTGTLEESLFNLRGAPNTIRPHSARFGTRVKYAKFHQYGTENMPKREIVFNPPFFAMKFSRDVADYLLDDNFEIPSSAISFGGVG